MAESIMKARREPFFTRIRALWRILRAPAEPTAAPAEPIAELMAARVGEVRRMEYEPIGIITQICTPAGWIIFPNGRGPTLARFDSDKRPDLVDAWEWDGLPDFYELTDKLCPDCQVLCVECTENGELKTRDILIAGEMRAFAPGERPCIYGNQLQACGGTGMIPAQDNATCPTCHGTGRVTCRRCGGGAYMGTGRTPDGKLCASCGGAGRVRNKVTQDLVKHLDREFSPFTSAAFLGPILKIYLSDENKATQIWFGKPDDRGNYPHIVNKQAFLTNSRSVILGGILRPELRNTNPRKGRHGRHALAPNPR
jgi:hypothetical protein